MTCDGIIFPLGTKAAAKLRESERDISIVTQQVIVLFTDQ